MSNDCVPKSKPKMANSYSFIIYCSINNLTYYKWNKYLIVVYKLTCFGYNPLSGNRANKKPYANISK